MKEQQAGASPHPSQELPMSDAKHTLGPILTQDMASDLADELRGLQDSADEPERYNAPIAALRAIAIGLCRVVRTRRKTTATGEQHA